MPNRNLRSILTFALLTCLPLAALTLTRIAHGQALMGAANPGVAAPMDAARPYSYVFLDPLEGQHKRAENSGNHVAWRCTATG